MINLTPAFKQKLFNDERDYLEYADITLENNTVLHLTNANFWQNGFSIEDSVGDDNTFSALGATVINSCTLVINNIYDDFSEYDFTNAKVVVSVGMELPNPQDPSTTWIERAWKGTFMVDEATYNGSIITLKCLDDMAQFDRPYSQSTLTYPATLGEIVRNACSICLGSANDLGTQQFPHYDYSIPTRPEDESVTFREVISWCATIAGCFARFAYYDTANKSKLELKWFNQTALEQHADRTDGGLFDNGTPRYSTGDSLDGGTLNPWNTGDVADAGDFTDERPFHHIFSLYSNNISVDDVVITGVRTTVKDDDDDSPTETITALTGTEGYVIDVSDNEFITKTNATEIRTWLGQQLIGLTFRKASVTHPSDPSIEAGDIAFVYDRKGNEYPIVVTRTVFNGFGTQTTVCGADTPNRNSATRYNPVTKSYVETRKKMKEQKNQYDQALDDLEQAIENAQGMYETVVPQTGGGNITYVHNKPTLAESDVVIELSSVGVTVTSNYSDPNPTWYGLTVTGDLVANLISALGINFNWAVGTSLLLGGSQNGNGILRVLDENDLEVVKLDKDGIEAVGNLAIVVGLQETRSIEDGYIMYYDAVQGLVFRSHTAFYTRWRSATTNKVIGQTIWTLGGNTWQEVNSTVNELYKRLIYTNCDVDDLSGGTRPTDYTQVAETVGDNIYELELSKVSVTPRVGIYMRSGTSRYVAFGNQRIGSQSTITTGGISIEADMNGFHVQGGSHYIRVGDSYRDIDGNTIQVTSSSKRYKHDITDEICEELDPHRLYDLKMKQFVYNEDHEPPYACMRGKTVSGFIAEDVAEIYPAAIIEADGQIESWSEAQIIAPMLFLIQEQKKQIDEQQEKIELLEKQVKSLSANIELIMQTIGMV